MRGRRLKLKSAHIKLLLAAVIILQVLCAVYFGGQKAGFHEDEYYSYYSSNRTAGFYYPDRTWLDTSDILKEFTVVKGEGFHFGLVHLVQSWDVHPPLYYDVLHLVCSLTPDIFSKWQGLGINIAAFVISQIVLYLLVLKLAEAGSTLAPEACGLAAVILWGFSPAAMSMIMFIRMYAMLTMWILLCSLLHVSDRQRIKETVLMALVTFAGFLTHYYYAVFLFFAGLIRLVSFLRKKRAADALKYAAGQGTALILAVAVYPSAAAHILKGYRGKEAQAAFLNFANLKERGSLFIPVLDEYVFGGVLLAMVLVAAALLILKLKYRYRNEKDPKRAALWISALLYFAVVSKTALQLGASSLRYVLPVCPLLVMLFTLLAADAAYLKPAEGNGGPAAGEGTLKVLRVASVAVLCAVLLFNTASLLRGKVLFLYTEEKEQTVFAAEEAAKDVPAAVVYNPATPYNMYRVTNSLLCYDRVYMIDPAGEEPVEEEAFDCASEIVLYMADDTMTPEAAAALMGKSTAEKLWNRDMYTVYLVK